MSGLRRARADDHAAVVRVLTRAFDADPVANYMFRQDAHRARAFELGFGAFFRHVVLPHDEAWIHGEDGVALWTPPGAWQVGALRMLAMGPALLRAVSLRRAVSAARAGRRVEERHPHEPHWYLFTIGVDPDKQGHGIGSALLGSVLDRCDQTRACAYLEASTPSNARLYERHGFRVTEEFRMAEGAPPVWLMWRTPRDASQ